MSKSEWPTVRNEGEMSLESVWKNTDWIRYYGGHW